MCAPTDTIARQDFEALAAERGWTPGEILRAIAWMKARKDKRLAEARERAEIEANNLAIAKLESEIAALKEANAKKRERV